MKTIFLATLSTALFLIPIITSAQTSNSGRVRVTFNENWLFQKGDPAGAEGKLDYERIKDWLLPSGNPFVTAKRTPPAGTLGQDVAYTRADFDDSKWRRRDLPHDWAIEGNFQQGLSSETGKRPFAGVGWYRKHFALFPGEAGKKIFIDFDGAMSYPAIWVNGKFVGGHAYGYASFRLDLTPFVRVGKDNVIAVRLDNPPDSSRWYPGAGIYRNVWFVKTSPVHVAQWGTYITTPNVSRESTDVNIKTTIDNDSTASAKIEVKTTINSRSLRPAVVSTSTVEISASASQTIDQKLTIEKPLLWDTNAPNLYTASVQLRQNGKLIDTYETTFGVRSIKFNAEKGFLLNGEHIYLKGVCMHHDLGALGAAMNLRALERQLEILKEMGGNAIRTSHNPPAPELLDLADKMGFVVLDEGFDAWLKAKKPNDYHRAFVDWHEIDWRSQIRRDRNHPSVVLWSIGNEIEEQGTPEGHKIAAELTRIAHEEDPTRQVTAGANNAKAGYNGFQATVDVFGYNYRWKEYEKFRSSNPSMPLIGSETASTVSSRGEYFFPVANDKSKGRQDFQVSSYDLSAPPWAWPPDTEFGAQDRNPFLAGEFVWTGFDYLGEPTPYMRDSKTMLDFSDPAESERMAAELKATGSIRVPSRSSYFGIVDLCGFKKDRFYIYQARWRPDLPMAHILPHWNWPERVGQITPVHVYTSGDEAELFLNGRSLGRKKRGQFEYRLRWDDVKYEPGELRVITYNNGRHWAEDVVRTAGEPSQILMHADHSTIRADGTDLSFVTLTIVDKNGVMVPRSKNQIKIDITGPSEIVGMDNGDATDLESFQSKSRKAYNGLALVIVRSKKGQAGAIRIRSSASGLKTAMKTIFAR